MTISANTSRVAYQGPGAGPFAVPFKFFANTDLLVTKQSSAGIETALTLTTHYSVTGAGNPSGTVTLVTALASGESVVIRRVRPVTQETSLRNAGNFAGAVHEDEFDHLVMLAQQLDDRLRRAFGLKETYDPASFSLLVKPGTAGQLLGWLDASTLTNFTVDSGAIVLPGESRSVATMTAYLLNNRVYNVEDYGAIAGATTAQTRAAILAAFSAAQSAGGGIVVFRPRDYDIGNLSNSEHVFEFTSAHDIFVQGNGARIVCNTITAADSQPKLFAFLNCERIYFDGLRMKDNGADSSVNWRGTAMFWLRVTDSGTYRNFTFTRCGSEKGVAFLQTTSYDGVASTPSASGFIKDITIDHCFAVDTYYGVNQQDAGSNLRVRGFRTHNAKRSIFLYGIENFDVDVTASGDASFTANDVVLLKHYYYNLRNGRVRVNVLGEFHASECIGFQQQPTGGGNAYVDDIEIDLHIDTNGTKTFATAAILFDSYLVNGSEQTTTTNNRWDRIKIRGSLGNATANPTIKFGSANTLVQTTEGRLYLDESWYAAPDATRPYFPGFVVRTGYNREFRTAKGNLTGGVIFRIPLAGYDGNIFALVTKLFATDYAGLAADHTLRWDRLIGHNAGGGAVVIDVALANIFTSNAGVALVPTFTANGEFIDVTFAGVGYNAANSYAKLEVEYEPGPQMGA